MSSEQRAIEIATTAHSGQTRWGGEPFIVHPLAVAEAFRYRKDGDYRIVALLHDVVEDGGVTAKQLWEEGFSARVCAAVHILTKVEDEAYDQYIGRLLDSTELVRRVKIADIEHNLSTSSDKEAKNKRIIWRLSKLLLERSLLTP